jgi:uncharacterized protein (UPF0332 family)
MAFDWREYFDLALLLREAEARFPQEAASRSAASRAYYAAFCCARNYACDRQMFMPKHDYKDHELVREHFRRQQMPKIARKLQRLRQWRNQCDYDDVVNNLPALVENSISHAHTVLDLLA